MTNRLFPPRASSLRRSIAGAALSVLLAAPVAAIASEAASDLASSVSIQDGGSRSLQLGVGRSMIVDLPEDATEIFVGEPKVANAIVRSPRRLYISTLSAGSTTIFALGANGRKIAVLEITVGRDVGALSKLLEAAIPGNDIHVRTVNESIILTGSAASAGEAQKAVDIANGFIGSQPAAASGGAAAGGTAPGAGKVVNSLTIRGLDQVSLRVTVSEIRRDIVKQLGIGWKSNSLGLNLPDVPGINGASLNAATGTITWGVGLKSLTSTLEAYESHGVVRTLAEPTVTAVSGESAKFLAGGTIPIPGGESCSGGVCQLSIMQQPYGVTLNFTPVVLDQGRIQLRVATEVTDIDPSVQQTILNTTIPGFRTRKNETTVELPSGGSIVSAGLISSTSQMAVNGLPGLMNLPILGAMFRSHDYNRQETELLIMVTPYIVHAVNPKDLARADENFVDASTPQGWLLGRINRIYSTSGNLQPMPTYTGKVGFITD